MPRTRWELSRQQQKAHVVRAKRLAAMGVEIIEPKLQSNDPGVRFDIGYAPKFYNVIFNSSLSTVTLITGARIIANRARITLEEMITVTLPWEGSEFEFQPWSPDSWDADSYRVAPGLTVFSNELLPLHLDENPRLLPGKPYTGLLLAIAYGAQLPQDCEHGTPVSVGLTLYDSFDTELCAEGTVFIDRRAEIADRQDARKPRHHAQCAVSAAPAPSRNESAENDSIYAGTNTRWPTAEPETSAADHAT